MFEKNTLNLKNTWKVSKWSVHREIHSLYSNRAFKWVVRTSVRLWCHTWKPSGRCLLRSVRADQSEVDLAVCQRGLKKTDSEASVQTEGEQTCCSFEQNKNNNVFFFAWQHVNLFWGNKMKVWILKWASDRTFKIHNNLVKVNIKESVWCLSRKYVLVLQSHTQRREQNTKNKHKIFPLFFFPTLRLHRVTDVALRGIYICILFTAYFDVFVFTWSKRSAKNTVLRTNQNSKWVQNLRKRYSLMTQQFSVQYSTMQISFIHIMLNIHIFFWETKHHWINQQQKKNNRVLFPLTFVQIETLNHAPTTPTHTNSSYFDGKMIRKSRVCSGLA